MTVTVVTDSSACLPADLRHRWGIRQVPLHILLDGADLRDGVDQVPDDVHQREGATTAAASPAELLATDRQALADSGGAGAVAVHISSALSGTFRTATHVAAEIGPRVHVVDSRSTAMGTGFVVLAAARAAASGAGLDAVVAAADSAAGRVHAFLVVHRLDNLRRSGRIGSAAAWLGTALSLKPVLCIDDGELVLAQRIRTAGRAVAAMVERVGEIVGDRPAVLAVHHVANPAGAADLAAALAARLPAAAPAIVTELAPVLALHVGAGALAVAVEVSNGVAGDGGSSGGLGRLGRLGR